MDELDEFFLTDDIFEMVRSDFTETQHDVVEKLRDALTRNDFKNAEILVHTLKTIAAMMAEEALSHMALQMELGFKNKENPTEDTLKNLEAEVKNIINR